MARSAGARRAPPPSPLARELGGARILLQPETGQHRTSHRAEDLDGHRWMFIER
jgi:hypothetical protein